MIRALVLLLLTIEMMRGARSFLPSGAPPGAGLGACLGFGFLVLIAVQVGTIAERVRLPRLTGYFLAGFLCGPEVSGLLSRGMVDALRPLGGPAVGLIALIAGCEINVALLKKRRRTILAVGGTTMPITAFVLSAVLLLLAFSPRVAFLGAMPVLQRCMAAAILGVMLSVSSPSAALGILTETASAGPLSDNVLGSVVLVDIAVVLAFAGLHAIAGPAFGDPTTRFGPAKEAMLEVLGAVSLGLVLAGALAIYIRRVQARVGMFALGLVLVATQIGSLLHLDVLVTCLTAGLAVENVFGVNARSVRKDVAPVALPLFAVFFADSGARLHVHDLWILWPIALGLATVRAAAQVWGARTGLRLARADTSLQRWMPYGMISQVGMSAGLAVTLERLFPTWGLAARPLLLSVVTIDQLVGPVVLRGILVRSGEAGLGGPAI